MTKREIILIVAIVIVVIGGVALVLWKLPSSPSVAEAAKSAVPPPHVPVPTQATAPEPDFTPSDEYPQLSLKTMSKDEALKIYLDRSRKDEKYDWKVALNFYGKVVDENNQPVVGANVHYSWNTAWVPGGSLFADTSSDGTGLFSLTGKRGKILEVTVSKEGYYPVEHGNGRLIFEYADPSSPEWYEPDPNSPVIFHLRRKGEGAKLFSKSFDVPLNQNHPQDRINLMQGFIKPDGVLTITSDTSKHVNGAEAFPWTVTLSMGEGGLVETDDQFPFMAPTSGYTSTVTMDMTNLDRSVWRGQMTKTYYFYLPSTNTYGRMTVNASSSLPLGFSYAYNLAPGNRTLEPASK